MTSHTLQPVTRALSSDRSDIEELLDSSFGLDRHARTTYRLREGNARLDDLSFVLRRDDGHLCGSIEFWPIEITDDASGKEVPAVLLGPIAVSQGCRGQGVGSALMKAGIAAAYAAGHNTIILVGDPAYYERFGFSSAATKDWKLPGSFEQHRLLARTDTPLPQKATLRPSCAFSEPHQCSETHTQQ